MLCQICHHWRELALSLPFLWNSLAASGLGPFIPHPALIELRISRSRGHPLSLHFALSLSNTSRNNPLQYHSHASKIFELFSEEMHRWRTISFVLNNTLIGQFLGAVDSKARDLQELDLVFDTRVLERESRRSKVFLPPPTPLQSSQAVMAWAVTNNVLA